MRGRGVNSGKVTEAGMKGWKEAASGFVGRAPTISGYSIGRFPVSTVAISGKLPDKLRRVQVRNRANGGRRFAPLRSRRKQLSRLDIFVATDTRDRVKRNWN